MAAKASINPRSRISKRQRITAAEDDFPDGCVGGEVLERCRPARSSGFGLLLAVIVVPAEAVAAMHGTGASGDQQGTAVIFVQQSRCFADIGFMQWVG
jgi:hypothetical protein